MIHADRTTLSPSTEEGFLTPKPPFDFATSVDLLCAVTPMRDDHKIEEQSLTRAVAVGGQTVVFKIRSIGLIKNPRLKYTLYSERPLSSGLRDAVIDRIGFFLSLSDDLESFYRIGYGDVDFAPVLQKYYGLHHVKFITPFESATWAVLSQRYPMGAAQKVKQAIMEKFGTSLEIEHQLYRAFPEPPRLASASGDELMPLVRNKRRNGVWMGLVQAFCEIEEGYHRTAWYHEAER